MAKKKVMKEDVAADFAPRTPPRQKRNFSHFASQVASWSGSPWAFGAAAGMVIIWGLSGPYFHYSESWQIVINTSTTIITFLMVFVIQSSQNRESLALHLKLDELIRSFGGARNIMVAAEEFDEERLMELKGVFSDLAADAEKLVSADRATPKTQFHRSRKKDA